MYVIGGATGCEYSTLSGSESIFGGIRWRCHRLLNSSATRTFGTESLPDLRSESRHRWCEVELQRVAEVLERFVLGLSLARHVNLDALSDEPTFFLPNAGRQFLLHVSVDTGSQAENQARSRTGCLVSFASFSTLDTTSA
jgi:hypothetical protein